VGKPNVGRVEEGHMTQRPRTRKHYLQVGANRKRKTLEGWKIGKKAVREMKSHSMRRRVKPFLITGKQIRRNSHGERGLKVGR